MKVKRANCGVVKMTQISGLFAAVVLAKKQPAASCDSDNLNVTAKHAGPTGDRKVRWEVVANVLVRELKAQIVRRVKKDDQTRRM